VRALVIAGTASGVGKTTLTTGLIAALARRGFRVQPFKAGPDYIDPTYHELAAGRPSRNLDAWMLAPDALTELFARAAGTADVAIVEGVMGLYDGKSGGGDLGSTAHVATLIGAPVVMVLDAARSARSLAAVALGFRQLDPRLDLAGVVLNNLASPAHCAAAAGPIQREAGLPVLGWLRRDAAWSLPERYLGLVPTPERPPDGGLIDRLAEAISQTVDVDRLLEVGSRAAIPGRTSPGLFPPQAVPTTVRIAVARDEAFTFYYQDNLDLLRAWGAELIPFSPRRDERLPPGAAAVYVGGGFPELVAAELAENLPLLADLRRAAELGMPIYAECGGLMYLAEGLVDADGRRHRLAGVLPGWSSLRGGRLTLGYREVQARRDSLLLRRGERIRGHEFHWSVADGDPDANHAAYDVLPDGRRREGYAIDRVLASYVHLHFGSNPRLAPRFVEAARAWMAGGHAGLGSGQGTDSRSGRDGALRIDLGAGADAARRADGLGTPAAGPLLRRYGLPPEQIERSSMLQIDEALGSHLPPHESERSLVARLVYAAGDPSLANQVTISPTFVEAATTALAAGATVVADVRMVAGGLSRESLARRGSELLVAIETPDCAAAAAHQGITRTAAGMLTLGGRLDGAVVAIGNAPTALLAVLDLYDTGVARPAAVIGLPVGFVAAPEAKEELLARDLPSLTIRGTRGGSPLAAAALNHLLRLASTRATLVITDAAGRAAAR
jgi:cobyrinic acid a,c-diamide synthase